LNAFDCVKIKKEKYRFGGEVYIRFPSLDVLQYSVYEKRYSIQISAQFAPKKRENPCDRVPLNFTISVATQRQSLVLTYHVQVLNCDNKSHQKNYNARSQ